MQAAPAAIVIRNFRRFTTFSSCFGDRWTPVQNTENNDRKQQLRGKSQFGEGASPLQAARSPLDCLADTLAGCYPAARLTIIIFPSWQGTRAKSDSTRADYAHSEAPRPRNPRRLCLALARHHGVGHWARVLENGLRLAESTEPTSKLSNFLPSSMIPGVSTKESMTGTGNVVPNSQQAFTANGSTLSDDQFDLLYAACVRHTDGGTEETLRSRFVGMRTAWTLDGSASVPNRSGFVPRQPNARTSSNGPMSEGAVRLFPRS